MTPAKRRRAARARTGQSEAERRRNHTLREVLDELVQHVRVVARTLDTMTPAEVTYAQERLEWLADEVWRIAAGDDAPEE